MISPTRRSAIPVSTSGVRRLMNRSLSRSTLIDGAAPSTTATRQPSPSGAPATADDLHTFTLLEENIALKESCEQLGKFHADQQQRNQRLHAELVEVRSQCDRLQQSEATVRAQLHRTDAERLLVQTTCAEHEATVAGYQQQLRALELKHENAVQQAVCQREHATDGIVGALRAQLAATELQLYEANEKIAELTEENGRSQAECASVTAIARMVCGAVPSSRISMGANAVREIKSQYDIFASVARATPDSRSLLAALQLMVTASSNGTTAMGADGDAVAWNGGVQQQQQPPPKTPQPQQPQQPQQQQQPPVKQSPAVGLGGNAAVGGDDNGRIVQMQMPPPPHNNNKHQQRPPPPPVPPRHFNTAHATGSLGTVHTHIIATNSISRPNGPDSNGINAVHLLPSPHHPPYVHRPYPPQTMPTMATGMDNMTAAPRQQVVMEDTIFV